jgi:mono/diheme cytochrome c family protein
VSRAAAIAAVVLFGCDLDLERMIDQPRYSTYEECDVCPERTIMLRPPDGTVARDQFLGPPELTRGVAQGRFTARIPIEIDRELLARGKNRFDIFCAACHGRLGNGVSQVAENMTLRMPPDLLVAPYRDHPPGRVFAVISDGFGLMRSYAGELPLGDRWAVVAYLEALRLSQAIPLDDLPAPLVEEAGPWLR